MNYYFNNNEKLMTIYKFLQHKEKEFMRRIKRYFIFYHLLKKIQKIIILIINNKLKINNFKSSLKNNFGNAMIVFMTNIIIYLISNFTIHKNKDFP